MPFTTLAVCVPPRCRRRHQSIALLATFVTAAVATLGAVVALPAAGAPPLAPVSATLTDQLAGARALVPLPVMVHGTSITTARSAAAASGMTVRLFDRIGVVVAAAHPAQIQAGPQRQAGVTYVEGDAQPIAFFLATSNKATRGAEARPPPSPAPTAPRSTGKGVSVAVIDSGVDGTHPFFQDAGRLRAVVATSRRLCEPLDTLVPLPAQRLLPRPDRSTTPTPSPSAATAPTSAGIVAGRPTTLTDGGHSSRRRSRRQARRRSRPAPGSHPRRRLRPQLGAREPRRPVRRRRSAATARRSRSPTTPTAPPAAAPSTPRRATVKLQRALAADGVVTVWAAGNDGGDGSDALTNPPGQDPTRGILSVASYDDQDTGTRDGAVSDFCSRGAAADPSTWPDVSAPGDRHHLVLPALPGDLLDRPGPRATVPARSTSARSTPSAARRWPPRTSPASSPSCSRPTRRPPRPTSRGR